MFSDENNSCTKLPHGHVSTKLLPKWLDMLATDLVKSLPCLLMSTKLKSIIYLVSWASWFALPK